MKNSFLKYWLTSFFLAIAGVASASEQPPNIVLIFADDLGYGDVGCYGATKLKTPNIDKLAAEGRRFTDAHSASAVCTPSRYALLTGEYPFRQGIWGPCHPNNKLLIDTNKLTIAKLLKKKGYDTSCFGKWHLGFGETENDWKEPIGPGPNDLGFDYYYGVPVVNSAPPYVYVENDRIVGMTQDDPLVYLGRNAKNTTPITPLEVKHGNRVPNWFGGAVESHKLYNDFALGLTLTEKATEWIGERGDNPFFLYLATTQIHHPFTPAPQFQGTSECGLYGDFVHELDWMVGEVMKALEEKGAADNTLVLFTSDNGGMFNENGQDAYNNYGHEQNGELLGFKFGAWEGGHRVPFIARWPKQIEAGSVSEQLICNIDMLATFAGLTDQPLDEEQQADSLNILPALVGEPDSAVREHLVLAPVKRSHLSVRKGKWMFIDAQGSGGFGGTKPGGHGFAGPAAAGYIGRENSDIENGKIKSDAPPAQLYDLESDLKQTTNVYREHPEVVEELSALLKSYADQIPGGGSRPPVKAETKYDGFEPVGDLRFTFESGELDGWKVVEGKVGLAVSNHASLPNHTDRPYNHEGRFHLSTIATADAFSDQQQVVFQSPEFVIEGDRASFLASGGYDSESLFVGLVDSESKDVLMSAGGAGGPQMKRTTWDVSKLKGKTVYLQVVDQSTGGWGHLTFDDFSVDGTLSISEKEER